MDQIHHILVIEAAVFISLVSCIFIFSFSFEGKKKRHLHLTGENLNAEEKDCG